MVDKLSLSEERILYEKAPQQPLEMTVQGTGQQRVLFLIEACGVSDNLNFHGVHAHRQLETDYTEEICKVTTDVLM